jgi:RimJ/RimL family protein N-acetyltransferase
MRRTARLLLRRFTDADREPFAELNRDPRVMEHFPAPLDRAGSDELLRRHDEHWDDHGFGAWAVEHEGAFVGFVGLVVPARRMPCGPCVEVGWRLARDAWGKGIASEAAREALRWGFEELALDEVVSFTVPANVRSRAVMERIGMTRDVAGDFEHPALPEGHPLRPHVLYRAARTVWIGAQAASR